MNKTCETCKFDFDTWCNNKNCPKYCKNCPNFDKNFDDCRCNIVELIRDEHGVEYCPSWTAIDAQNSNATVQN